MAKSKKSGAKSLLFWGILLGVGFLFYRYQQKGTLIDDAEIAGRFGSVVDDALASQGVTDSLIISTVRIEQREKFPIPRTWIETERHISRVSAETAKKIFASIKKSGEQLKLDTLSIDSAPDQTILEAGRNRRIFQRLIFVHSKTSGRKVVAIVIDDVAGRPSDVQKLDGFLALGIPITYALLPKERVTHQLAEKIHRSRHEMILHQPMEPHDLEHNPPGKVALLKSMSRLEIDRRLEANLLDVPHAAGFSNHMGSEFTANPKSMSAMLDSAKKLSIKYPGLYFFDSHTTQNLISPSIASQKGVQHLTNDLFLDNEDNLKAMIKQLDALMSMVLRKGHGVAIGHIQRKHMVEALKRAIPEFKKQGIQFVYLSDLLK